MGSEHRPLAVAILAAGQGKRMGDPSRAKVLADLHGRPLLGYVLDQAATLAPSSIVVIVGHQREAVASFVSTAAPKATCVVQEQQLGTGHAVRQTEPVITDPDTDVLILSGDVPLLRGATLQDLVDRHRRSGAVATVLTTRVPDPTGYGRIVRDADGRLTTIVEHKDASDAERAIDEINSGVYVVHAKELFEALAGIGNSNAQNEYYLTDIIGVLRSEHHLVDAWCAPAWEELHGINTVADLERAADILTQREAS
jgi:UDP-N-acetylglucosamine diphosphorylase/glucosamine-1-phosphate N-acetyltransferase